MGSKVKDFVSSVFKFSVSTWVNFIVGLMMTIVTTRLFSEETLAVVNIFNAATTTGMTIVCLGLDSGYIRFFHEPPEGEDQKQMVFKLMLISTLVNFGTGSVLLIGFYRKFSELLFSRVSILLCITLFVNIFANIVGRYLNITYRMRLDTGKYTIQNVLFQSMARVLIIFGALIKPQDTFVVCLGTLGTLALAGSYLFIQRKDIFPRHIRLDLTKYKGVFRYSIFCAPTSIAINLNTLATNLIIKQKLGLGMAGIYSSTVTIALIINVIQGGFSTFWSGYMFANYDKEQRTTQRVHDFFMLGVYVLFVGLLIFKDVVFILVGRRFQIGKTFFVLLLIYPLIVLTLETTSYGISIAKKTYITLLSYLIFLGCNVGLCFFFIPLLGVKGAALASSFAAFVLFLLQTTAGQKYYRTITRKGRTYSTLLLIEGLAIIDTFLGKGILLLMALITVSVYIGVMYRKELMIVGRESKKMLRKG